MGKKEHKHQGMRQSEWHAASEKKVKLGNAILYKSGFDKWNHKGGWQDDIRLCPLAKCFTFEDSKAFMRS